MIYYSSKKRGCFLVSYRSSASFFKDFEPHSICGMDESVIVSGRPYGGDTILYRQVQKAVEAISLVSRRVCTIKIVLEIESLYIFNIYICHVISIHISIPILKY